MRLKYRNVITEVDGIKFRSRKEARRYSELLLMKKAGAIRDLELQPRYPLEINGVKIGTYVADFIYRDRSGVVVEDTKGVKTKDYVMKKRLMLAIYGIDVKEV